MAAVKRWFDNDWQKLDNKIKSSIVEGVSVFLSMFDMPDVAAVFCPPPPEVSDDPRRIGPRARAAMLAEKKAKAEGQREDRAEWPAHTIAERPRHLPPLYELIESGKVLALNMPAGSNPALARAIGVMLKNAWLQALLMRPGADERIPHGTYFRPAVFICDEYQSFASVGEDDPTGDEKILCFHAAMPVHPDCCDPIHILIAGRAWQFGGVAGAATDTPHPDLSILERRRQRQDCIGIVRAGCQDQRIVHDQRDLEAGGRVPAIGPGRWRRREHRRNQVFPGAPGGRLSPARLRLAWELSGDLLAL